MNESLVFINIGWMVDYRGPSAGDPTRGGHGWLRDHTEGHEAWNFAERNGRCYGNVPGKYNVNMRRFAGATHEEASGITVVWVARHPESKRYVIVGWYLKARVLKAPRPGPWRVAKVAVGYQIVADASDVYLIPRERRTFPTPGDPQIAFGRSVIYYGNEQLLELVPKFIRQRGRLRGAVAKPQKGSNKGGGRQQDAAERKRIETAAIAHATRYYAAALGDEKRVRSVESECCGWDLEATQYSGEVLLIEVKGTSGREPSAELTVNEYAKLRTKGVRERFVIYIVTEAGTSKERSHIFRFRGASRPAGAWRSDDDRELTFKTLEAARVTVAKRNVPTKRG